MQHFQVKTNDVSYITNFNTHRQVYEGVKKCDTWWWLGCVFLDISGFLGAGAKLEFQDCEGQNNN